MNTIYVVYKIYTQCGYMGCTYTIRVEYIHHIHHTHHTHGICVCGIYHTPIWYYYTYTCSIYIIYLMYIQIYIYTPYMIYAIYGLFKTVKMTFNTWEKIVYEGSLYKKHLQDYLHFPLLFLACFCYNLITEWSNTLPLLFGALNWVSDNQSLNVFQGLSKAWDNSLHLLRGLFVFTCCIALLAFRREANVPRGAQRLKTHLCRTAMHIQSSELPLLWFYSV